MDASRIHKKLKSDRSFTFLFGQWNFAHGAYKATEDSNLYYLFLTRGHAKGNKQYRVVLKRINTDNGQVESVRIYSVNQIKDQQHEAELVLFRYLKQHFGITTLHLSW